MWHLTAVRVGEHLPTDRESFLLNLTTQLRDLDEESKSFQPIIWHDKFGAVNHSPAHICCILADSSERTVLDGHLAHSASQGCVYCLQVLQN